MKLAILSMQRIVNFGSVLQAYALRQLLRQAGAEVEFLDIEESNALPIPRTVTEGMDYEAPANYPPGIFQRGKRWCIARLSAFNRRKIRAFMKKELKLDAATAQNTYDGVVIGSDEVFNHARGLNLQLHGQVKQSSRVITYAASCGSALAEDIPAQVLPAVRDAMGRIAAFSVRDGATERYVQALCGETTQRHLDPVLTGELYRRVHRPVWLKKYMIVYAYGQRIRTDEEIRAIRAFAKARGLKIAAMGGSQFWCDLMIPANPMRMLDYFYYADYVVTDTFHGTIFSVINQKQFAVIPRQTNREKLTSLLEDLGLQDRLLRDMEQLEQTLTRKVDYLAVEQILARERERTRRYLQEQLEGWQ